jgi:Flp pilus assembly protein TadG
MNTIVRISKVFSDRRAVAALEMTVIFPFMILLLFPVVDIAVASFQFITAFQAMRDLGQYAQFHAPPDVTDLTGWSLPTLSGISITHQVMCGDSSTACSAGNTASPKYLTFSTTVAVSPLFLTVIGGDYPISYAERFQ